MTQAPDPWTVVAAARPSYEAPRSTAPRWLHSDVTVPLGLVLVMVTCSTVRHLTGAEALALWLLAAAVPLVSHGRFAWVGRTFGVLVLVAPLVLVSAWMLVVVFSCGKVL